MWIRILGGLDIISGLILILNLFAEMPSKLLIIFGIILILKSFLGILKDFASWIDFLTGISFFILIFTPLPKLIILILVILIAQKGIRSFI